MLRIFYPKQIADSAYVIDYKNLYRGYEELSLILIIPWWNMEQIQQRAIKLINKLKPWDLRYV